MGVGVNRSIVHGREGPNASLLSADPRIVSKPSDCDVLSLCDHVNLVFVRPATTKTAHTINHPEITDTVRWNPRGSTETAGKP
eukprot:419680-Pyramimonas_sp.AAC.1